jgi:hypothetical protein
MGLLFYMFGGFQGTVVRYFLENTDYPRRGELRSAIFPITPEKRVMEGK